MLDPLAGRRADPLAAVWGEVEVSSVMVVLAKLARVGVSGPAAAAKLDRRARSSSRVGSAAFTCRHLRTIGSLPTETAAVLIVVAPIAASCGMVHTDEPFPPAEEQALVEIIERG